MTLTKDEILHLLGELPEPIEVEELIYRLYLREKLAAAEADLAAGRTLTSQEVREQASTWRR